MAFYALEHLVNLYDGYRQSFSVNRLPLLLIQEEGQRYLLLNQCPHQQAPLDKGRVVDGEIHCVYHGMRFNLQTGISTDGCESPLQFFPIAYEGSSLGVDL